MILLILDSINYLDIFGLLSLLSLLLLLSIRLHGHSRLFRPFKPYSYYALKDSEILTALIVLKCLMRLTEKGVTLIEHDALEGAVTYFPTFAVS
ncbi:MAG: hypothetical protein K2M57_07385, partial [Paramuribaculum sp.]|nr:hypothetical protein [Paramuribaculum sp.]